MKRIANVPFSLLALLVICFTSKAYSNPRILSYEQISGKYPNTFYLVGIGEAPLSSEESHANKSEVRKIALDRARIEIAKQIRITVKEITTDEMTETSGKFKSNFSVITESMVEDVLEGVRVVQEGIDNERCLYWAVAVLPREDAIKSLTRKMQIASRDAEEKISKAYERKGVGDIASALKLLLEAREKSVEEMCYDNERAIIKRPLATDKLPPVNPNLEELECSIEELLKGIELLKVAGDKQQIRWGALSLAPLVVKVLCNNEPISTFPIRWYFKAGDGILEENSVTDKNGLARSLTHFIDLASPTSVIISAEPDIEKLSSGKSTWNRDFINELDILSKSKAVDFQIMVSGFSSLSMVAEALIQKLQKGISQDSLCLYIGEFTTNDISMEGDFTRYFKNKIKEGIITNSKFKVVPPSSKTNSLTGYCWVLNDMIDMHLEIQDPKGNSISIASVSISIDEIETLLPPLKLQIWTEKRNLICKEDESINFYLRSNRNCYVSILDLVDNDNIKKFVPNYPISGGRVYKFIEFNLPYGVNTLKVLGNKKPLDINVDKIRASNLSAQSLLSELIKEEAEGSRTYQEANTTITKLGIEKETSFTPDLKLDLWTERGKNPTYKEDEAICFNLKANKGCYVYFFGFTSNGNILKLALNHSPVDHWINGNEVNKFQFDFTPPIGVNKIKVFASENPLNIKLNASNSKAKISISSVGGKRKDSPPMYADATSTVTIIGNGGNEE